MEHHAPHAGAAFEGYYSKFDLPSGAHIALIACKVRDARQKPNMLSFTFVPKTGRIFQKEVWAEQMEMTTGANHAFTIDIPGIGFIRWKDDSTAEYSLHHADFSITAETTTLTPWSAATNTPEGLLVRLPLPLHWHVQSLASQCSFRLAIPTCHLGPNEAAGHAVVHQEKNWAYSFPSAHIWIQARDGERGLCGAGGQILGLEAFLLGYRSRDINLDFRPPLAVRVAGWSPFLSYAHSWDRRTFELSVSGLWYKLTVQASAPKGSFFALSSPFPDGHRENMLSESFDAVLDVAIYERSWSGWRLRREDRFENASLEFGGRYYSPAGSEERSH